MNEETVANWAANLSSPLIEGYQLEDTELAMKLTCFSMLSPVS
jgi:hypothetical protein